MAHIPLQMVAKTSLDSLLYLKKKDCNVFVRRGWHSTHSVLGLVVICFWRLFPKMVFWCTLNDIFKL